MELSWENSMRDVLESPSHDRTLDLTWQHDAFAEEAFVYLLDHFGIQTRLQSKFRYFTEVMGRAIVTIGYIFRRRLRTFFQDAQIDLSDVRMFQNFAAYFETVRSRCYFFRILRRISHIFELTMYCLMEGYNYIEDARKIVAYNEYIVFFDTNGGWSRLNETASFIAEVGEILQPVTQEEKPHDKVLKSFVKAVQYLEVCSSNSISPKQREIISLLKRDAMTKLNDIHIVDPRVTKVFHNTICQHSSNVFAMNSKGVYKPWNFQRELKLDIQSEKEMIINTFRNQLKIILDETEDLNLVTSVTMELARYFSIFRHLSDLISAELDVSKTDQKTWTQNKLSLSEKSFQSLNEYFIVSYDYIRERECQNMKSLPDRSVDSNVRKILNENIDQNNYFKLNDGQYVVHTPDCQFDRNTTAIFIT